MTFRTFKHAFHESYLTSLKIGPKQEIALDITLSPVFNKSVLLVRLCIEGIKNFDETSAFFKSLPLPERDGAVICELYEIEYSQEGRNWVLISTLNHGKILVQSNHVSEF